MKKAFKVSTAAAIALSTFTPVAVFAAEANTPAETGFYTNGKYVSRDEFKGFSRADKRALLIDPSTVLVVGGKVYFAKEAIGKTNAELEKVVMSEGTFEARYGELTKDGYKGELEAKLEVKEVSAINQTTVEVEFSQAVGDSARLKANYNLRNADTLDAVTVTSVVLSEDGKKATLKTANLSDEGKYLLRFNNITDTEGEAVTLADETFTADFPDAEPTISVEDITVIKTGTASAAPVLTFQLPEGVELDLSSGKHANTTAVNVLKANGDDAMADMVDDAPEISVDDNNVVTVVFGSVGGSGTNVPLTADDKFKLVIKAGMLSNEYGVSNSEDIEVEFTANAVQAQTATLDSVELKMNDAGNDLVAVLKFNGKVHNDGQVQAAAINLIAENGKVIKGQIDAIAENEATDEIEVDIDIAAGDILAGNAYTVYFDNVSSNLVTDFYETAIAGKTFSNISGLDTEDGEITGVELISATEAKITFNKNVVLDDKYEFVFNGTTVKHDGTGTATATAKDNVITITADADAKTAFLSTTFDRSSGLAITGANADILLESGWYFDGSATLYEVGDSENGTVGTDDLVTDNATPVATWAELTNSTTVTVYFSEDVEDNYGVADNNVSVVVRGKEEIIALNGTETTEAITVTDGSVVVGDTLRFLAGYLISAEDDQTNSSTTLTIVAP